MDCPALHGCCVVQTVYYTEHNTPSGHSPYMTDVLNTPTTSTADARSEGRHRTLKAGRIEVNGHASTFDCMIRDMSARGARLVLKAVWIAPEKFDLLVLNPNTGKSDRHACLTAWQKGTVIGVRFTD